MTKYAVFISYGHAADDRLAPALQRGLQRLAKPFYRRYALAVFRDKTGLAVDESLWGAIVSALDQSRYFLLLASPESAASPWVGREVSRWLENNPDRRPLIALTDGDIAWNDGANDFDWSSTNALPRSLGGVYTDEPLWIDLRWAKTETHLSLRHPQFRDAVADLAATAHGVSKDQITGRDLREHRRTLTAVWSAVTGLVLLTAVAVGAAVVAHRNEQRALSRQLAAQSLNALEERRFDRALLLAVEAAGKVETHEARDALMSAVQRQPALVTLLHGAGKVRRLAFSPDGLSLASASSDRTIRVWDVARRRLRLQPFPAGKGIPSSLVFDADGDTLAAIHPNETVLWDLTTDPPVANPVESEPPDFAVRATTPPNTAVQSLIEELGSDARRRIMVGPKQETVAVATGESVELWSVRTGDKLGSPLSAQGPYVRALAFNPRRPMLASGSSDGTIALWDLSHAPLGRQLEGHRTSANYVMFSDDGKRLATAGYSGEIMLWDPRTGDPLGKPTPSQGGGVGAMRFSPSEDTLLVHGKTTTRWRLPDLAPVGAAIADVPKGAAAAISPDLTRVAIGKNDGEVEVWDLDGKRISWQSSGVHGNRLFALSFSPDGKMLASAGNDRVVALWDSESGQLLGPPLDGHRRPVSDLEFSADGTRLASYDSNGTIIVWDVEARKMLGRPLQREADYAGTSAMALSADARVAASSGKDGFVRLWDVATWRPLGEPLMGHPADVVDMAFSSDGSQLATAGLGGAVILWDLHTDAWIERACRMANRGLTAEERLIYLSQAPDDEKLGVCERLKRVQ